MRRLLTLAAALLSGCSMHSNWYLMDSGYSINPVDGEPQVYAIEMHLNQLKQLGGEVNSAEFRLFLSERLQWHGICPRGWQALPCVEDGSCVQHTRRSITVPIRCASS
jgi:hypothetical protein